MGNHPKRIELTEGERARLLQWTSPDFQAAVRAEEEQRRQFQEAAWKRLAEAAKTEEVRTVLKTATLTIVGWIVGVAAVLAVVLTVIYALIRFVKWSWQN